ncbi:protease SohB [Rheinheimera sp.]|uniref:protease SohB n=1 Tax=Rheinheimera sp. TaxID=1869214 RepID=UPI0027B949F1|nr:protease SohB [Rheinheimera sp.]
MDFLLEYSMFFLKALTIVFAIGAVLLMAVMAAVKPKIRKGELTFDNLSEEHQALVDELHQGMLDKKAYKKWQKQQQPVDKTQQHRLFVVDFHGSMDAHEVEALREEVTAVLAMATKEDEVLVRLESGGGVVHGYGLAASQLDRLRQQQIPLTVAVDKVAASGGYMMACIANKIIAAPFAIVGSIGVLAQIPNFHKLLKKNDVDFEMFTAGEYKRTVTVFGENTDKGRAKFQHELEETHLLFKDFVQKHRPVLDINAVATGEHWFAYQAFDLKLVDELKTSDDYLLQQMQQRQVFLVKYQLKKRLSERMGLAAAVTLQSVWQQANRLIVWR